MPPSSLPTTTTKSPLPAAPTAPPNMAPMWGDWVMLALVSAAAAALTVVCWYMLRVRRTTYGQPVNFCNVPMLVCQCGAGVVHMYAALVANGSFPELDFNSAFWTLWMQFVLGCGAWLMFITLRTFTYAFLMSRAMRVPAHSRRHVLTALIGVAVMLPPVITAIVVSSEPAKPAQLGLAPKLVLVVGLLVGHRHAYTTANVREIFRPVRDVLLLGLAVTGGCAALVFSALVQLAWGRCVYVLLLVVLHVGALARLIAVPLWHC